MRTLLSASQRRGPEVGVGEVRTFRRRPWKHRLRRVYAGAGQTHQSFNLIDTLAVGVDRIQRNFEPLERQVETWRTMQITDDAAKFILYSAFIDGKLEAHRSLLPEVHRLYFEPRFEEFSPTMWSLSNAFTSAFNEAGSC